MSVFFTGPLGNMGPRLVWEASLVFTPDCPPAWSIRGSSPKQNL